ncbi:MAG: MFS transporter [Polyangiaceae bacterium]
MTKPHSLGIAVVLLIYAAFLSLGLPDGILGAAWPQIRAEFSARLNDNWRILMLGTCGGLLSSTLSGPLLRRLGIRNVLLLTTFLTAAVVLGLASAPSLAVVSVLGFFLGLGNGAIDAGLNNFVANNLSSRHMNWLHAFWGVGISLGTLSVSGILAAGGSWRVAYALVGVLQLGLGVAFLLGLRGLPAASSAPSASRSGQPSLGSTLAKPVAWASLASFFAYCGLESGIGVWISSVLHDGRGWSMQASSLMVSVYWSSLTVGRFLVGAVSTRTSPMRLVRAALLGVLAGTSLIAASSLVRAQVGLAGVLSALGLLVTGLSLAPIFPMLMHDTPRCVGRGHALNLIGIQSGSGGLGYALLPVLMGALMRRYSTEWLGFMVTALALALLALLALRECSAVDATA